MRARGVRPCVRTASAFAISSAADASESCEAIAAVSRPPSTSVGSERILSRFGSRGPSSCVAVAERDDLLVEAALGAGTQRALVRLDRERLHVVAGDVPLLRDHLRAAELRDLLRAVARFPARRPAERVLEAVLLAREHRRADRDRAHVLHAARDDEIGRARHHAPARRSARPAATIRTGGRRWCRAPRRACPRRASTCARCRRPADRSCRRSRTRRRRRRRDRRRRGRTARGWNGRRDRRGAPATSPPLRFPTGRAHGVDDVSLVHRRAMLKDGRGDPAPVQAPVAHRTGQRPRPLHVEVQVVLGRVADRAVALQRGLGGGRARPRRPCTSPCAACTGSTVAAAR